MKSRLKIRVNIALVLAWLLAPYLSFAAEYENLGVNLVNQGAFVNVVNQASRYQNVSSFDSLGWPQSDFDFLIMDNRPVKEWAGDIDDPEEYRIDYSGVYKGSFKGSGNVEAIWNEAFIDTVWYEASNNTTYFDLVIPSPPGENHCFIYLRFTNTKRAPESDSGTGVTEIKVTRPGYDLNTDKVFTDEYIELCKAANFACYRFYGVQNIWGGEPEYPEKTEWSERKTPKDASQLSMANMNGKRDGWCWEYIIMLANILNRDIWINIHMSCDSNYVLKLAEKLKDELNPGINIYVENSNEVWAPAWNRHGPYNQAQAEDYGIGFNENYARRTVELSGLFAQVFGEDAINDRIRVICAGQHAFAGRSDYHLEYINNTFGPPKNYIYALSSALYFGSTNPGGAVEEINQGMVEEINGQINDSSKNTYRLHHINKAEEWELPGGCTSYEGGPGLPSGGELDNLDNQIMAQRTEAMKDIMKMNFAEGWFDIGGGLALQFTLASGYNRYGCWGLTDDYTNPDRNYKMQAMRELVGERSEVEDEAMSGEESPIELLGNSPNPFASETKIRFYLSKPSEVKLEVYNIYGEKVGTIINEKLPVGEREAIFDGSGLPEGTYFYKLKAGASAAIGKCVMLR